MKKFYKIIIVVLAISVSSCTKFLEENPETLISETSAYTTESSLESNIVGCYQGLIGDSMITGRMNQNLHISSGLMTWRYASSYLTSLNLICSWKLTVYPRSPFNYSYYCALYKLIYRCNKLLEGLETSPVDEAYKKEIEGEAHFLRAVAYYYVVRSWGDAPLLDKCPTSLEEANHKRDPFWKIYQLIISDLEIAYQQMRSYDKMVAFSGASSCRTSREAAKGLLAQVYLTIATDLDTEDGDNFWDDGDIAAKYAGEGISSARDAFKKYCGINSVQDAYLKAKTLAKEVIESNVFELAPTYAALFRWTQQPSEDNDPRVINQDWELKERMFTIPNTVSCNTNNYTEIRALPMYYEGTSHTSTSASNSNWGLIRPHRFLFQHWCNDYPGVKGDRVGYNNDIYVTSSDPRVDVNFIYTSFKQATDGSTVFIYPNYNRTCCSVSASGEAYFGKYADPRFNANSGYADFYVMRYAEMYLIVAEASAQLCASKGDANWTEAMENIEVIHKRARTKVAGDGGTGYSQPKWEADKFDGESDPVQALRDAIFWEREYEMPFEGHEYFDTHRHGAKWLSRMIARPHEEFLQHPYQKYSSTYSETKDMSAYTAASYVNRFFADNNFKYPSEGDLRKSLRMSFPYDEIVNNLAIDQNDQNKYYWEN